MKKYIITAAVVLGMVITLTACGKNEEPDITNDPVPTADASESLVVDNSEPEDTNDSEQTDENVNYSIDGEETGEQTGEQAEMKMNVQIGDYHFTATLENNAAVSELVDMLKEGPVTIQMDDYSGFEKVGPLGRSLTTSNSQTTTSAGDIVLYNGSNIVMFYGSNSWSYTRIGRIDDLSDWKTALGSGSITAIFTLAE